MSRVERSVRAGLAAASAALTVTSAATLRPRASWGRAALGT
jgi:hypothetical protein